MRTKTVIAAQVLQLDQTDQVDLDRLIEKCFDVELLTNGATVREVLGTRSGVNEPTADLRANCADLSWRRTF